jgi:hypothetical protein
MKDLQKVLDACYDTTSLFVRWSRQGFGWGEFSIKIDKDGAATIDDEGMSKKFMKRVLTDILNSLEEPEEAKKKINSYKMQKNPPS